MIPSIPFLLTLLVCSIFATTSELTNHDRNVIYWHHSQKLHDKHTYRVRQHDIKTRVKRETNDDPRCKPFEYKEGVPIRHPQELGDGTKKPEDGGYSSHTTCFTSIETGEGKVIELTFVNKFELEEPVRTDEGLSCKNDYIEIRDGQFGYALRMWKFCGKEFPPTITSAGPFLWLKFRSDDSIQYAGFEIEVEFQTNVQSRRTPDDCFMSITKQTSGVIDSLDNAKKCRDLTTAGNAVDFQWRIETEMGTQIYLNFTHYKLAKPNECDENIVQVFGAEPNHDHELDSFCGSVAASVTTSTKKTIGNIMHIRMYTKDKKSNITAQFTAFRTMGQGEDECASSEFDCLDGTCIDLALRCNGVPNCRLKADEDPAICTTALASPENDPQMIMIVFSVILAIMITIFIVKCALKVYRDQKQINEHLLSHGGLDKLSEVNLSYDPIRMTMEPEPRASLERENHANEMYKQQRSKRKSSSIESDFLRQSTTPDRSEWPESVPILPEDIRIEHKGRTRSHTKREDTLRAPKREWNEIRAVSFEAPDTQDSGCQTRDSLFQADPPPSSGTNSGSNSRQFSGARPSSMRLSVAPTSPAARPIGFAVPRVTCFNCIGQSSSDWCYHLRGAVNTECVKHVTPIVIIIHADRRPMSNETTRSAPDVIIVSKPIN